MGIKGSKIRVESIEANELLLEKLASIDGVSSKKMFGGFGIFHNGKMFGLIDSKGVSHLKADDETKTKYLEAGSEKHSRMPYYSIPKHVKENLDDLLSWTQESINLNKD